MMRKSVVGIFRNGFFLVKVRARVICIMVFLGLKAILLTIKQKQKIIAEEWTMSKKFLYIMNFGARGVKILRWCLFNGFKEDQA